MQGPVHVADRVPTHPVSMGERLDVEDGQLLKQKLATPQLLSHNAKLLKAEFGRTAHLCSCDSVDRMIVSPLPMSTSSRSRNGSGSWARTNIRGVKGRGPTVRRSLRSWLRDQGSNLESLGSEPSVLPIRLSLINWQAAKESNPPGSVLETNLRPARDLWRMAVSPSHKPFRVRSRFQRVPAPWPVYHPMWRKADNLHAMPVRAPSVFETAAAPWLLHLPNWRMAVGDDPHTVAGTVRVQAGGAPCALHHPENWRRTEYSKLKPFPVPCD